MKRILFYPTFRALVTNRLYGCTNNRLWRKVLFFYNMWLEGHYGVSIPVEAQIGESCCLPHSGNIILNPSAIIGNNVCISPGVLIGGMRGKGAPVIGDNVYIGNGAKIIGNIRVGNNVFIAPNSVVVKDVEDDVTIGGTPAKVLNHKGKENVKYYLVKLYKSD